MQNNKVKALIFDFDGTIADSFELFLEAATQIVKRNKPLTPQEITRFRSLPLVAIISQLDIKKWQIPFLVIKGRKAIADKMDRVKPFTGMTTSLKALKNDGYQLFVVSTNSSKTIRRFLQAHGVADCFSEVYGDVGLLSKSRAVRKLMRQFEFKSHECLYIGDETRDIEATRKVSVACVAVAWGFSSVEALQVLKPAALVMTPAELEPCIVAYRPKE